MSATATIARAVLAKPGPRERQYHTILRADAKLYWLQGNERPHFSLTGELRYKSPGRRRDDIIMCGCLHDELVKAWPVLAPLVAIHLSDDRGVPMHAAANGGYWLGFTEWQESNGKPMPQFDVFARSWRVTEDEARALYVEANALPREPKRKDHPAAMEHVAAAAVAMAPRWQAEADAAAALIRDLAAHRNASVSS